MKPFAYLILVLLLAWSGCTGPGSEDHISSGEITRFALEEGSRISTHAQQALGSQLTAAMQKGGPVRAVEFCNTAALPILDSLTTAIEVKIKRVSHRWRNPADAPGGEEMAILENYLTLLSGEKAIGPIVDMKEGQVLFTKPILLDKPLCLNCHGSPDTQITPETMQLLGEFYPEDKATGHQLGDLRGMWSLTFDKETLINYMKNLQKVQ